MHNVNRRKWGKNWSTRAKRRKAQQILKVTIFMGIGDVYECIIALFTTTSPAPPKKKERPRCRRDGDGAVGMLGRLTNESTAPTKEKRKKNHRHGVHTPVEHGEKAKFRRVFFRKNKNGQRKNCQRRVWRKKTNTDAWWKAKRAGRHREKREEKKDWLKLAGGRRRSPLHIISKAYFQGELTTEKEKIIFECESLLLLRPVSPQSN